ncbi:MAG: ParB/RepB/Spo0J family partition protein [Betaproteobacteria bacterium]|nr:ParB/RepB/Spo0J family partition protein [Betaproteobacteria bacterium]
MNTASKNSPDARAPKKRKGLGLGLEALLGAQGAEITSSAPPSSLPLDALVPGQYQPRTRMDEGALFELAESIKAQGIMQPILVRPLASGKYEIIAGERRSRAARLAGLDQVPVLVREVPDQAALAMALIENIQREDLNPLEEAQGIRRLIEEFSFTHEQAAQAVGRSRVAVSNLLRLLNLAPPVQDMLLAGDLDMGHARALLALDGAAQVQAAHQVQARRLSVRETERLCARRQQPEKPAHAAQSPEQRELERLETELGEQLGAPVHIRAKGQGKRMRGEIALVFHSLDELNGLIDLLRKPLD